MASVKVYIKDYCTYCTRAKALLDSLNVEYEEIDITNTPEVMEEISQKSGFRTVPQIFVGDKCLGGSDNIHALNDEGRLMAELKVE